ncbi:hypothetical protein EX895_002390 [Sporisorium graminicola]|uniref:Saccharopine dehydrogenase NADP binding domain-containing protein n=1 Tax=Sporisorium graminicola TaxID=280036 RepID=A0A4V6EU10_9BASI|nr:hypothetical protein EX895_002390 [Sporisorium graminicola]TKY88759.1 hypothetical protein EX895_002390 [Sporisorium graminicola]
MSTQRYDLVVFGATGYTGQLVCRYLLSHPQKPSWAIAGRSASRLSSLKSKLGLPSTVGVIEAETSNYASLTSMTSQARALVNIVGPYRPFKAFEVVRACVETSTNYTDLSGETGFNKEVIDAFHLKAQAKGVTLASSAGFDSLPFDLTTFLAAQKAKQLTGGKSDIKLVECAYSLEGGFSAGTLASGLSMADEPEQMHHTRGDWLSPIAKPGALTFNTVRWFEHRQSWGAQNTFTVHNTRIINRSWGLLQHHNSPQAYGQAFLYREGALVPFKLVGIIVAYANAILMWLLMNLAIVRSIAAKSMPANSGPSEKSLVNTKVRLDTLATANDGTQAICTLKAKGHPGYLLTARMIVETALTILDDKSKKINPLEKAGVQGGALTPALIGAERLAQRLVEFGHFEITTEKYEGKQVKKTK